MREQIEIEVKKEFGIYEALMEIKALQINIEELKKKVSDYTKTSYDYKTHKSISKIDEETDRRLAERNGLVARMKEERQKALDQVWLFGQPEEFQELYKSLPEIIGELMGAIPKLPAREILEIEGDFDLDEIS